MPSNIASANPPRAHAHRNARRVMASIALGCVLAQLAACSSTRFIATDTVLAEQEAKVTKPPGLSIAGYVTTDGVRHPFDGTVTLENDYFVFHPAVGEAEAKADTTRAPANVLRLPRTDVTSFNSYQRSHPILIIGICAALAAGIIALGESMSN
jgi:hypothetical protein